MLSNCQFFQQQISFLQLIYFVVTIERYYIISTCKCPIKLNRSIAVTSTDMQIQFVKWYSLNLNGKIYENVPRSAILMECGEWKRTMLKHLYYKVTKQMIFRFKMHLPKAWITGTDRILHVAVTKAPHFLSSCVNTQPTGEHPSVTKTLNEHTRSRIKSFKVSKYAEIDKKLERTVFQPMWSLPAKPLAERTTQCIRCMAEKLHPQIRWWMAYVIHVIRVLQLVDMLRRLHTTVLLAKLHRQSQDHFWSYGPHLRQFRHTLSPPQAVVPDGHMNCIFVSFDANSDRSH